MKHARPIGWLKYKLHWWRSHRYWAQFDNEGRTVAEQLAFARHHMGCDTDVARPE